MRLDSREDLIDMLRLHFASGRLQLLCQRAQELPYLRRIAHVPHPVHRVAYFFRGHLVAALELWTYRRDELPHLRRILQTLQPVEQTTDLRSFELLAPREL